MTAPDQVDDAGLLSAHLLGEPQAFARLYDRHDRRTHLFVRRMLGPAGSEVAEDVHQEVWLAVARAAGSFDPGRGSFAAWLYTIARRKALDALRARKVVPLLVKAEEAAGMIHDPDPSPLQRVETRELALRVVAAVEALPLEQRETFILFAEAELSLAEVAKTIGVPIETAKSPFEKGLPRVRGS